MTFLEKARHREQQSHPAGLQTSVPLELPGYQAVLIVTAEFRVFTKDPVPNRWRRFWHWALLGWKWERL